MNQIKTWEELTIQDDFLFAKVMRDKEICQMMLEKLLKVKIKDIVYLEEQKTINIAYDARSVRLDVYVEDDEHRIFNVEMQAANNGNLAKRSRYYQGMIDLNTIEKGKSYKHLKESYIIFICAFDPFKAGLPQYTFENYCTEQKDIKLADASYRIFYNALAYDKTADKELSEFLKYVCKQEIGESEFIQTLAEKTAKVKANREWRAEYMKSIIRDQELREEGIAIGRAEGRAEGRAIGEKRGRKDAQKDIARNLLLLGLKEKEILTATQLSLEEYEQLRDEMK